MASPSEPEKRAQARTMAGPEDHVIYNNIRIPLRNWSPVGLLFGPLGTTPEIGQKFDVKVQVKFRDDRLRFDAACEVIRTDKGMVAVRYECKMPETALQIKS